jgi:hypothetical protein
MGQAKVVGEKLYRSYYFDFPPPRSRCHSRPGRRLRIYQLPTESWSFQTSNLPQVVQS